MAKRVCVLVLAGALFGACSDGDGGDKRAVEQQRFVAAADALCGEFYERTSAVLSPIYGAEQPDVVTAARELPEWLAYARLETDRLLTVPAPDATSSEWSAVVADLQAGLDAFEPAVTAARAGDGPGLVAALDAGFAGFEPVDQRMKDLGLKVCGSAG